MVPSIKVLCHDETQEAVDLALRAIAHVLQQRHKLDLAEHVLECFWDGKIESMNALKAFFPNAKRHFCLEHAKRNAEKLFTGGYMHFVINFVKVFDVHPSNC